MKRTTALHKLLNRQLNKLGMDVQTLPTNPTQWRDLLEKINKAYIENDQERYLLERSMEISSRELKELNQKLENAQAIAKLGYWFHDIEKNKSSWSKELYKMFEYDTNLAAPDLEDVYRLVHPDNLEQLQQLVNRALQHKVGYTMEMKMKTFKANQYRWYYVEAQPVISKGSKVVNISGIVMDINARKNAEKELIAMHQQILSSARRMGMADAATSILHNVGNILNSANVSVEILEDNANSIFYQKLLAIYDILLSHQRDFHTFLTQDPQGKLIPAYLVELIRNINQLHKTSLAEIMNVKLHIQHIKNITDTQQSLGRPHNLNEKVYLPDIIDMAIKLSSITKKDHIKLERDYMVKPHLIVDQSKLLHILINLLNNAKESVMHHTQFQKFIKIKLFQSDTNIGIQVSDNGIGIDANHIDQIFSFGYTTKEKGHGFGLHSGAISAKEMGGKLTVASDGINKGASFTLLIPNEPQTRSSTNELYQSTESIPHPSH